MRLLVATAVLMAVAVPPSAVSGFQPSRHADVLHGVSQSSTSSLVRPNESVRRAQSGSVGALQMAKLGMSDGNADDATAKEQKKRERAEKTKAKQEVEKSIPTSSGRQRSANAGNTPGSFSPNALIAPLAPLAAIGAGRAYLTRRKELEEERRRIIEEEERELARRLAEIENNKNKNGVSALVVLTCNCCILCLSNIFTVSKPLTSEHFMSAFFVTCNDL